MNCKHNLPFDKKIIVYSTFQLQQSEMVLFFYHQTNIFVIVFLLIAIYEQVEKTCELLSSGKVLSVLNARIAKIFRCLC